MEIKQHLEKNLKRLKMPGLVYNLELRLQEATDNQLGHLEFLSLLIQDEIINREPADISRKEKTPEAV